MLTIIYIALALFSVGFHEIAATAQTALTRKANGSQSARRKKVPVKRVPQRKAVIKRRPVKKTVQKRITKSRISQKQASKTPSSQKLSPLLKTALLVAAKKKVESSRPKAPLQKTLQKRNPSTLKKVTSQPGKRALSSTITKKSSSTQAIKPAQAHAEWEKLQQEALFIWPIKLTEFWISSFFGPRKKPNGAQGFHSGLDLAACRGTNVHAAAEGVVTEATHMPGYGNYILIVHNEEYKTRYAHLDRILVKRGQKVLCGDLIGKVGATGTVRKSTKNGSGSHLHFEVYKQDKRVNPLHFLA